MNFFHSGNPPFVILGLVILGLAKIVTAHRPETGGTPIAPVVKSGLTKYVTAAPRFRRASRRRMEMTVSSLTLHSLNTAPRGAAET